MPPLPATAQQKEDGRLPSDEERLGMTTDQLRAEVQKGTDSAARGEIYTHEEVWGEIWEEHFREFGMYPDEGTPEEP